MTSGKNNYIKYPFIIIGLVAWILIVKCSKNELFWDMGSQNIYDEQSLSKSEKKTPFPALWQAMENDDIDIFFEFALSEKNDFPENINDYFQRFYDYCNAEKNTRDITYLLNNMPVIKAYCLDCKLDEPTAIRYSEYIPYYCIKKYELENNKRNPKKMYDICTKYLKSSSSTNHISKKSAQIICLQVRSFYKMKSMKKKSGNVQDLQNMITRYQQQFPAELGKTPKNEYIEEAAYLERFLKLCENILAGNSGRARRLFDYNISELEE